MAEHTLKCWPSFFNEVWQGLKHHEVRKDDRGFASGDTLWLREYDPETSQFSGVTCVTRDPFMPEGLCVLGFQHFHSRGQLCCAAHHQAQEPPA
jgi:hypothetical protein